MVVWDVCFAPGTDVRPSVRPKDLRPEPLLGSTVRVIPGTLVEELRARTAIPHPKKI